MKKILQIVLVLAMLINSLSFTVMASEAPESSRAVSVLNGLGYFEYDDELLNEKISRAEYIDILAAITGLQESINTEKWMEYFYGDESSEEVASGTTGRFKDVPTDYWAYDAIEKMADAGYISGVTENTFEPDRKLNYEEMVSVMLCILGYKPVASMAGGWSSGYLNVATELKMNKGISAGTGSNVTRADIAQFIYNTFNVGLFTWDGKDYEISSEKTFLSEYFGLAKVNGTVTENADTTFTAETVYRPGHLKIDNAEYTAPERLYDDLIGRRVEAYYSIDDESLGEIAYAYTTDKITEINISDIDSFKNGLISYKVDGKKKNQKIKNIPLIYNGVALPSYGDDLFDGKNGTVKITENEDAVIVTAYESMYVKSVSSYNSQIFDSISGQNITIDESEGNVTIYDEQGGIRGFSYITADCVLSVAENGHCKKIYVSDKKAEGNIDSISEGDKTTVKIGESEYTISKECKESTNNIYVATGNFVTAYINIFGEVVWVKLNGDTTELKGYMFNSFLTESGDTLQIKYLNVNGETVVFSAAQKVKVLTQNNDSKLIKDAASLKTELNGYKGYFKYKINANEEIISIELPTDKAPAIGERRSYLIYDNLDVNANTITYNKDGGHFENFAYLDGNSFIVSIPEDENAYDEYKVISRTDIADAKECHIRCYANEYRNIMCEAMLTTVGASENFARGDGQAIWAVTSRYVACDKDGEIVDVATLSSGTSEKIVYAKRDQTDESGNMCSLLDMPLRPALDKSTSAVKKGDLVLCITDTKNYVTRICKVFDCDKENVKYPSGNKGGMPGMDDDLFYIPKDYVDFENGTHTAMENHFATRLPSNPIVLSSTAASWDNHYFYTYAASDRIMLGYVYYNSGNTLTYTTQDLSGSEFVESGVPETPTYNGNYAGIYLVESWRTAQILGTHVVKTVTYDTGANGVTTIEIKAGKYSDVIDYYSAGKECSRVMTVAYNNVGRECIIINDNRE